MSDDFASSLTLSKDKGNNHTWFGETGYRLAITQGMLPAINIIFLQF